MFIKDMKIPDYIDLFTNASAKECLTNENNNHLPL